MTKQLIIATNYDDWEGLYVNGTLFAEGHKLRSEDIFEALGIVCEEVDACDYLDRYGSLPETLEGLNND